MTADPELGRALLDGHLAVAERADPVPPAAAARAVLEMIGGPLREGYAQPMAGLRGARRLTAAPILGGATGPVRPGRARGSPVAHADHAGRRALQACLA
ncbi:hypothetical protein ACIBRY_03655 [Streptomyces anulatus]